MLKKLSRVAIYARKSNDDDYKCEDNKSITRQIDHCKSYADKKGWIVSEENIFSDDGISGAEFKNRPGLINLRKQMSEYDVIVMSELSRLGRDAYRTAYEIINFIENGKRIFYYLTDEEEKADSATARMMLHLKSFSSEIEREKASERVTDALHRKAKQGYAVSAPVYGYDIVPIEAISANGENVKSHSEFKINKEEKKVVIAIFEMYRDSIGYASISKTLNGDTKQRFIDIRKKYLNGIVPSSPKRKNSNGWNNTLIRKILSRERYCGIVPYGKTHSIYKGGSKAIEQQDEYLRIDKPELRIVPDTLWNAVQKRIIETAQRYHESLGGNLPFSRSLENERDSKYLLSGISECTQCHSSFIIIGGTTGKGENRKLSYKYGCSGRHNKGDNYCSNNHKVKLEVFDEAVITAIEKQVLSDTAINYIIEEAKKIIAENNKKPDYKSNIEKELKKVETEIKKLISLSLKVDNLDILTNQIKDKQTQQENLFLEKEKVVNIESHRTLDKKELGAELANRMRNFSDMFRSNSQSARKALKLLLKEKIKIAPVVVNGKKSITFRGITTVGALLPDDDKENHIGVCYPYK